LLNRVNTAFLLAKTMWLLDHAVDIPEASSDELGKALAACLCTIARAAAPCTGLKYTTTDA
jgi:hypothetical protein